MLLCYVPVNIQASKNIVIRDAAGAGVDFPNSRWVYKGHNGNP